MAYFTITNVTATSLTLTVAELQYTFARENYSSVVLKIDGEIVAQIVPLDIPEGVHSFSQPYYFTNGGILESGKSYDFSVTAYTTNGTPNDVSDDSAWTIKTQSGKDYLTVTIPYPGGNISISLWTWTGWESSYNAITQNKPTTEFSRKTWNAIVSKVVNVLHNGLDRSWDNGYATVADTRMSTSSDTELTAIRFNSVLHNIEDVGDDIGIGKIPISDIPYPVSPGDKVFGEYFLTLTNYINKCITTLNNT